MESFVAGFLTAFAVFAVAVLFTFRDSLNFREAWEHIRERWNL